MEDCYLIYFMIGKIKIKIKNKEIKIYRLIGLLINIE